MITTQTQGSHPCTTSVAIGVTAQTGQVLPLLGIFIIVAALEYDPVVVDCGPVLTGRNAIV